MPTEKTLVAPGVPQVMEPPKNLVLAPVDLARNFAEVPIQNLPPAPKTANLGAVDGGGIRILFGAAVENVSPSSGNVTDVGVGVTVPSVEVDGGALPLLHAAVDNFSAPAPTPNSPGLMGPDGSPMQDYLKTRMPTPAEQLADDLQAFRGNDAERMREVAEGVNRLLEKGRRDDVEQALSATDNLVTFDPNTGVRILDEDRSSVSLDMLYRSLGDSGKNLSEGARRDICAEIARRHKQHLSGLAPGASEAQRADSQDYLMDNFTSRERARWSRGDLNRVELVSDRDRPYVELAVDGQIPGRQANVYGVENSLGDGELTSPLVMFRTDGSAPEVTRNHEGAHVETCMVWGKPASDMSIEELTTDELIARLAEGERDVTKMLRTVNEYRLDFMGQRAAIVRNLSSRTNHSPATENAIELYRRDIVQYADPASTQRLANGSIDALLKINEQLAYGVPPEEIIRDLRKAHTMQNYAQDA